MKIPSFPHRIKRGSATVTIYRTETHGYESFIVYYKSAGKTHRTTFPDFAPAKEEAWLRAGEMDSGNAGAMTMSTEDRASFLRAKEILKPLGIALEVAAGQYAEARKILGAISLIDAATLAARTRNVNKPNITVGEVAAELLSDRTAAGVCSEHLRVLSLMLKRVTGAFTGVRIGAIDAPLLKSFLDGMEAAPRTRNNYRQAIGQLVNFAKFHGYVPKDFDAVERIKEYKETPGGIDIYTPSEIALLLNQSDANLTPFLAIGAFAGLRHAEIGRLDWKDISIATGYITIQAAKSKTASRRLVPITDNLARWLVPHVKSSGPVCPHGDMSKVIAKFSKMESVKNSGFKWKHNALRHSFISYRVADLKNVAQVALEAGNSPAMIFKHYRELVTEKAAKEWFSVNPPRESAIIPMAA